jgi:hypothetical protein
MSFTVTTPATDRSLLTLAELRAAAGISDSSKDAELTTLGNRIAASIASACLVARSGAVPPTLRLETITETFRVRSCGGPLMLSRSPVVSIASITEGLSALSASDYDNDNGRLTRLSSDVVSSWASGLVTVVYDAGWSTVPDDLKLAAVKFVQAETQQDGRDPMLKSKTIEGVSSYEWWVDPTKDSVVPGDVMDILRRGNYLRIWV